MGASHHPALFAVLSCAFTLAAAQVDPCPAPESLSPCTCDYTGINCMKAKSTEQLAKAFSGKDKTIHRALWIQRLPIAEIKDTTFGNYAFGKVYVEINSNLTSFPLSSLAKSSRFLSELSLYGNALDNIDYGGITRFQKLNILNLSNNKLRSVPAVSFRSESLEKLILNRNPITSIGAFAFKNLPKLKSLELRHLQVKSLGAYSFSIPKSHPLLEIRLTGGKLETIDPRAFYRTAPFSLNLMVNRLKEFSAPVFQPLVRAMASNARNAKKMGEARISTRGNPFTCSGCGYSWLTTLNNQAEVMLMLIDFRCADQTPVWNITNSLIGCPRNARP